MALWNEIFGCVNYLKLPYDTVMNLPVHIRKYWIFRNSQEAEEMNKPENGANTVVQSGEMINSFAKTEQTKVN